MNNFETIAELTECYISEVKNTDTMKKVALYMRYSSKNQTEDSIEYQRHRILGFCYNNNYLPVKEYIDEAYTGTNDQSPGLQHNTLLRS